MQEKLWKIVGLMILATFDMETVISGDLKLNDHLTLLVAIVLWVYVWVDYVTIGTFILLISGDT